VNFEKGDQVCIIKISLLKILSHKFLGPYVSPFKVLEKKFPDNYKLELPKNLKVHPIFHVSLLKLVARDVSRPNQEYNSKPSSNLIDNELEFEMEVVFKSRQLKGKNKIKMKRIPSNRCILGE